MNELTEELTTAITTYSKEKLRIMLEDACENGDLYIVKYLLTSKNYKQYELLKSFIYACEYGHLDIVRYLLTSPDLKEHTDIHADNDSGFIYACRNGHLDIVRYLLTSPELQEHANIHVNDDCGFRFVIEKSYWHVLEYLLSLSGNQYIDFENTKYNLDWFIFKSHNNIIKAMIKSLYKNDMMVYLQNISKVEQYCKENSFNFDEWKKEITKDDEDININSHTTELFL